MADNPQFYRTRAAEERANAEAAVLDNVRERCERAAKAWEAMAARSERTVQMREDREAAAGQRILIADNDAADVPGEARMGRDLEHTHVG